MRFECAAGMYAGRSWIGEARSEEVLRGEMSHQATKWLGARAVGALAPPRETDPRCQGAGHGACLGGGGARNRGSEPTKQGAVDAAKPPVGAMPLRQRSSASRVRFAAPQPRAPWTPPARCSLNHLAPGGSGGIHTLTA
jgi:hypothetical protein